MKSLDAALALLWVTLSMLRAWDLSPLMSGETQLSHVTLAGARAFLAIRRSEEEMGKYTLVESSWPELPKPFSAAVKPFPVKEPQTVGDCTALQDVSSSDWDGRRYFFVLDSGCQHVFCSCPPKILVYDLIFDRLVVNKELQNVPGSGLSSLIVDTGARTRAYIAEPRQGSLIMMDFETQLVWEIIFNQPSGAEKQLFSTSQLALTGSSLFMASHSSEYVFKADLNALRHTAPQLNSSTNEILAKHKMRGNTSVEVVEVGRLLGPPTGLLVDRQWLGLYYCLLRDYACVRWTLQQPLVAESHEVLLQSAELLPSVHQLFQDRYQQVWALSEYNNSTSTHCVRLPRPSTTIQWKQL